MILQMSKQNFNTYKQLLINTSIQFIMKKIFFVAIAATLLAAGCQKTEVLNQVNPVDGSAMTFAPEMGKLTKAPSEAGLATLKAQDFRLWAYYAADDANRGASENGTKVSITADENGGTLTVTDFVVSNTAPDVDLMIADYATGQQKNGTEGSNDVNLKFRHALAKVEFLYANASAPEANPENDPNAVIVQYMYVSNVINKGSVSVSNQAATLPITAWDQSDAATDKVRFSGDYNGSSTTVPAVSEIDEAENIEQFVGEGKGKADVPTGYEMLLTKAPQKYTTWLVIPQTVATSKEDAAGLKVEIAYLIGKRQFVASFPLYADNAAAWNPNQYIKYNISLSPNMIGFKPTVQEWETTSGPDKDGNVDIDQ